MIPYNGYKSRGNRLFKVKILEEFYFAIYIRE